MKVIKGDNGRVSYKPNYEQREKLKLSGKIGEAAFELIQLLEARQPRRNDEIVSALRLRIRKIPLSVVVKKGREYLEDWENGTINQDQLKDDKTTIRIYQIGTKGVDIERQGLNNAKRAMRDLDKARARTRHALAHDLDPVIQVGLTHSLADWNRAAAFMVSGWDNAQCVLPAEAQKAIKASAPPTEEDLCGESASPKAAATADEDFADDYNDDYSSDAGDDDNGY